MREMCYRISDMGLCRVEKGHTYTLDEFRNAQFEQLEEVCIVEYFGCLVTCLCTLYFFFVQSRGKDELA